MSDIDKIVEVYISRETTQIETASFDIPMVVVTAADDSTVTDRVLTFTNAADVGEEFGTTSAAYIMAQKLFGQELKPTEIKVGIKLSTETWPQALAALDAIDDSWYILVTETHVAADQQLIAAYIETLRKMYFTSSNDVTMPTSATTDIASILENLGYDRTVVIYHPNANTEYPEAAWVGSQIVEVPGSNTWMFKSVAGVSGVKLNGTQKSFLESKNVNYYSSIAGVNIFQNGETVGNSWIDEIIFVDWLYARLQEQVFFRLINRRKIPYTRRGFAVIEAEIRSVLSQGVANGGIADDTPYTVISPDPLAIPEITRTQRIAGDWTFEARLAGAVHHVIIRGTVSA